MVTHQREAAVLKTTSNKIFLSSEMGESGRVYICAYPGVCVCVCVCMCVCACVCVHQMLT